MHTAEPKIAGGHWYWPLNTPPPPKKKSQLIAFDGCGGYFTTSSGILTSPNYPNKYPDSTDCLWRIVIPETNKAMRLVFSSTFYLKGIKNGRCPYDYVEVFNGNSSSSVSMGEFCGRDSPASLFTSTNEALILFHSNHKKNALGFELSFEAVDGPTGIHYYVVVFTILALQNRPNDLILLLCDFHLKCIAIVNTSCCKAGEILSHLPT